ncbi:MAG: glyoxalase [Gammaproteobacteria bacterium]|nr:glyoxalase [Gammaproteobacteria bacterium]
MSEFRLGKILHASVIVQDTQRALAFYRDVLGLQVAHNRPDLGYPGAWLILGEQEIHLLELPNPDPVSGRPSHGGRDRHIAVAVNNLSALRERLDAHGLHYTVSKSGRAAMFVRDPDGNALELIEQPG